MANNADSTRRTLPRSRPTFLTRAATDNAAQLGRRSSSTGNQRRNQLAPSRANRLTAHSEEVDTNLNSHIHNSHGESHRRSPLDYVLNASFFTDLSRATWAGRSAKHQDGSERDPLLSRDNLRAEYSSDTPVTKQEGHDKSMNGDAGSKISSADDKLGTFSGVFVPTTLNILSILMFLRFGFILGQSGVLGMLGMLVACYLINLVTTLSVSAIATNGTVRGGGAYYLISRSLGPEFGGSIGLVFYIGLVLNTGMNAVGLVDCITQNLGANSGNWDNWVPEGYWWNYLWATIVLIICTGTCLAGSNAFAKASTGLLVILLVSTLSIPMSALFMRPFESRKLGIEFTGLSIETLRGNLVPRFTKGAVGSQIKGKENYRDLFGILFPATSGIFAGASMSGDLRNPSKAIPKGTLAGLGLTFTLYVLVILSMAATITRPSFYRNINVLQETNLSAALILSGEFASSFFSSLMGVIGSAKLLQALARDNLLPGFSVFSQGTAKNDEPIYAIIVTYLAAQLTILANINQIASFVTMSYLMTFLITNLACFALKISSAPNFRPSFRYFNWQTAAAGTLISGATMFFVDGFYASSCVAILILLFLLIHLTTPPKSWGDVSQSLIYHQVRKYLLRLRQEHVKYWRPQILLLVNDPRNEYTLIQFCNYMKKGALYILGHVIVSEDFARAAPEATRQQSAWTKFIDHAKVKAFVNITVAPTLEWGIRNIVLGAGLGGMRPNVAVLGFYNLKQTATRPLSAEAERTPDSPNLNKSHSRKTAGDYTKQNSNIEIDSRSNSNVLLPTDTCKAEDPMSIPSYVGILEDLLLGLRINVAVAKGFSRLNLSSLKAVERRSYIDLWPIQMSAEIESEGDDCPNILTTNFDTYTLILQLGCILNTIPDWKKSCKLRVAVFVEYESDVEEERDRVKTLLDNLRMKAEVLVFWLANGKLRTYELIVNGLRPNIGNGADQALLDAIEGEEWWQELVEIRENHQRKASRDDHHQPKSSRQMTLPSSVQVTQAQHREFRDNANKFEELKASMRRIRRQTIDPTGGLVSLGMRTHRLDPDLIDNHAVQFSSSESSEGSSDDAVFSDSEDEELHTHDIDHAPGSERSTALKADHQRPRRPRLAGHLRRRTTGPQLSPSHHKRSRPNPQGTKSLSASCIPQQGRSPRPRAWKSSRGMSSPIMESDPEPSTYQRGDIQKTLKEVTNTVPPTREPPPSPPKFIADPVPEARVTDEDAPGPSIMFTASTDRPRQSIYARDSTPAPPPLQVPATTPATPATGYPSSHSTPLSFNDLPCRAQHLILNELIRQQSQNTAVVFTTLPSPIKGTCKSEADSLRYLTDLEVLCQNLPPTLLVQSNSMTVTMNL